MGVIGVFQPVLSNAFALMLAGARSDSPDVRRERVNGGGVARLQAGEKPQVASTLDAT
jgi:hypothetical protein